MWGQHRFINSNMAPLRCAILINREAVCLWGQEDVGTLHSAQFCYEPETALKNSFFFFSHKVSIKEAEPVKHELQFFSL